MNDYCKYVDVFYGNGEVDHYATEGIGSKWYYIKALCGNTVPHAVLPFGKISAGAYSGGYPCGYGTHYPNCCGGIKKLWDNMKIRGISHIHHSGTGGIQYYYNYAIVIPFYGDIDESEKLHDCTDEYAVPGLYKVSFNDIDCKVTVNKTTAVHSYSFKKDGGRLAVDFSNDGLSKLFGEKYYSFHKLCRTYIKDCNKVIFSGVLSGIELHFCVKVIAENTNVKLYLGSDELESSDLNLDIGNKKFGGVFDFTGNNATVLVSYSTVSEIEAEKNVDCYSDTFDETALKAYQYWNKHLSAIEIDADDDTKKKFYSNFYHSIVKPCDMTGECYLGLEGDVIGDISTFWDIYKTQLPLVYMLYPEISSTVAKGIINISRTHKKILCSIGLTDIFPCESQAKMLGIISLCDALYFGIEGVSSEIIDECIQREFQRDDYATFIQNGTFERYTHILDVADACLDVARITKNNVLKDKLLSLYTNINKAYSSDGLLSEKSEFYEGDRYTYSFRLHANMDDRIKLAGGIKNFERLLDDFFGFGKESVIQPTYIGAEKEINSNNYHRFQGFNNECDMESPYSYIYAGCHDKLCEIVHECVANSFASGKGAIPGNNDSGGLSSCYMWNALGLFPEAGKGDFLIGTPAFKNAVIHIANGNDLIISTENFSTDRYLIDYITFNGKTVNNYTVKTCDLLKGGEIRFVFK